MYILNWLIRPRVSFVVAKVVHLPVMKIISPDFSVKISHSSLPLRQICLNYVHSCLLFYLVKQNSSLYVCFTFSPRLIYLFKPTLYRTYFIHVHVLQRALALLNVFLKRWYMHTLPSWPFLCRSTIHELVHHRVTSIAQGFPHKCPSLLT